MSPAVTLALVLSTSLAAKPVAKQYQGPLDQLDVTEQSAGVLARFETADRTRAEKVLSELSMAMRLDDSMRVSFIRTDAGALAAVELDATRRRLSFGRYTALARRLSEANGVAGAWAFIAPGPRDDSLEQEAYYHFERGALADDARAPYRDDVAYLDHVRRKTSATKWHQARWPSYPLSRLSMELKLPGRACLDTPWQLQSLAVQRWPIDAGENLSLTWVELPGGMATEIQQRSLKEKRSPSSAVAETLKSAREAKVLGDRPEHTQLASYDEGQPDAEKHARRSLTLFLPQAELDAAEDSGGAEALSLSRVVQYAWRRAYPVKR